MKPATASFKRRYDRLYLCITVLLLTVAFFAAAEAQDTSDRMLNPFEDIDKITITNDPVKTDPVASDSAVQPEPQPPADNPMPTEPHNLLGVLLNEMNADEKQMFLSYQQELYSTQVESLRQQISKLQNSLTGLEKDREELAAAGIKDTTAMQMLITNAYFLETRTGNLLAAMLSGNMNPPGALAVIRCLSPYAHPQHPYFEVARLTLQLISLNQRLSDSLVSLGQIGQIH